MIATAACVMTGLEEVLDTLGPARRALVLAGEADGRMVVHCSDALTPTFVRQHVEAYARDLGTKDLAASASIWCKYYDAALQTGVLAAMVRLGIGLDVSPAATGLVMHDGLPVALALGRPAVRVLAERCAGPEIDGEPVGDAAALQQFVWRGLYGEHLEVLVATAAEACRVQRQVLWSNIASRAEHLYEHLAKDERCAAAARVDRGALLGARDCPWRAGPNPMHEPVRRQALGSGQARLNVMVRKTCCLKFRLPGRECCRTCPMLPSHQRLAREQREATT